MDAFFELSPNRAVYQGCIGYIPLSEIKAYFDMFGIAGSEDRQEYLRMIRALDHAYVQHNLERREDERSNSDAGH